MPNNYIEQAKALCVELNDLNWELSGQNAAACEEGETPQGARSARIVLEDKAIYAISAELFGSASLSFPGKAELVTKWLMKLQEMQQANVDKLRNALKSKLPFLSDEDLANTVRFYNSEKRLIDGRIFIDFRTIEAAQQKYEALKPTLQPLGLTWRTGVCSNQHLPMRGFQSERISIEQMFAQLNACRAQFATEFPAVSQDRLEQCIYPIGRTGANVTYQRIFIDAEAILAFEHQFARRQEIVPIQELSSQRVPAREVIPQTIASTPSVVETKPASATMTNRPIDLIFLLDATGSMQPYIDAAKTTLKDIIKKVQDRYPGADINVAVIGFRDYSDASLCDILPLSSPHQAESFLANLVASGGGDMAEAWEAGLFQLNQLKHRPGAVSTIFLVTDAAPHRFIDPRDNTQSYDSYLTRAIPNSLFWLTEAVIAGKTSNINTLIVGEDLHAKKACQDIASLTGGTCSGLRDDPRLFLESVFSRMDTKLLETQLLDAGYHRAQEEKVQPAQMASYIVSYVRRAVEEHQASADATGAYSEIRGGYALADNAYDRVADYMRLGALETKDDTISLNANRRQESNGYRFWSGEGKRGDASSPHESEYATIVREPTPNKKC